MKFVCDRCQTRYSIADEKVRQKILRIRCKTCGNVIVVQGDRGSASGAALGAGASESFESARTSVSSGPKPVPSSPKASPSSGPKSTPAGARTAGPTAGSKVGAAGPPPIPTAGAGGPDPLGGRVQWYVAIAGIRSGPFSRVEAAKRILAAGPGETAHVWKEGMPAWKTSEEVSVIARELSLLRPRRPPPPAPKPVKAPPLSPPAGTAKAAPVFAPVAKAASALEPTPQPIFPGTPLRPLPGSRSDTLDVAAETDLGVFSDITTKKAKDIHDLGSESEKGGFAEVTTKKGKDLRDLAIEPDHGDFVDVTTKEAKNPRDREAEPLAPSKLDQRDAEKTPPPVQPLPPVVVKFSDQAPTSSSAHDLPVAAPSGSFKFPVIEDAARSSATLSATPGAPSSQPGVGGFSEVMRAVAEDDQPSSTAQDFFTPMAPTVSATDPSLPPSDLSLSKGSGGSGLKYVIAVCVIVALVILIVMVSLRMDSRRVVDPAPAPVSAKEPSPAVEEPSAPKAVAVEPPRPEPVTEKALVPSPSPSPRPRSFGRRGRGKPARQVDPASQHQPTRKQSGKPAHVLQARPNPFDDSRSVSQSQISAVVRNKANQEALKSCYERALKVDNHLTSGRIDVTVSIGTSGAVQRVVINAPPSFILVEPCIKSAVRRWVFPPSSEEYATNFPLIMQGGM